MKKVIALMICSLMFANTALAATSVTGVKSMNNEQRKIDYKVDNEEYKGLAESLQTRSVEKEIFVSSPERLSAGLTVPLVENSTPQLFEGESYEPLTTSLSDTELAWLVENNIVSRDSRVVVGPTTVDVGDPAPLFDRNEPNSSMRKSEFLMGIYKAIYGVIPSRPLVMKTGAWRDAQEVRYEWITVDKEKPPVRVKTHGPQQQQVVSDGGEYLYTPTGKTGSLEREFPEGDYVVYQSPNVYELYLKELVDKNIVDFDSISDTNFRTAYLKLGENEHSGSKVYPSWYKDLAPYSVNGVVQQISDPTTIIDKVWGKSYEITGATEGSEVGSAGNTVVIEKQEPHYFMKEALDTMSALRYVESILRLTEKDMTDTEARIVTYKYGSSYLNKLDDADRKTVMFLTAKGVLNFEDKTEYRNLYGNLTNEFAYKLIYRLANKNARVNFSEIQLTDSDNFWLDKGFSELQLKFNVQDPLKADALQQENYDILPIPDVEVTSVEESDQTTAKTEVKILGLTVGKSVSRFADNDEATGTKFRVTAVFDDMRKYRYKGMSLSDKNLKRFSEIKSVIDLGKQRRQIVFEVIAGSGSVAVTTISANIQIGTDSLFVGKGVSAVTKYEENGKQVVLVPAASFKDINSDIVIMEDKVLKNKHTGAMAVLLPDSNLAIVGTHVIHSSDLMVMSLNGEVYYNLEIIKQLMSNAYISKLDPNSVYISKSVMNEELVDIIGTTGNKIGSTYTAQIKGPFGTGGDTGSAPANVTKDFVNISQMTSTSNFIIRNFEVENENKETVKFKVLLHFVYTLPDKDEDFLSPVYDKNNPTLLDVNRFLYNKPKDNELADWWENNIALSNALVNVMYETSGVEYVRSGYLVPNVTILYDKDDPAPKQYVANMLAKVGTELPSSFVEKFVGDTAGYNKIIAGSGVVDDATNKGGIYYPEKKLQAGEFPKWVYTQFNNSEYVAGGDASKNKNGNLWRSLMSNRNLILAPSSDSSDNVTRYVTEQGNYVVTAADMVFKQIDGQDSKFPAKLENGKLKLETRTEENQLNEWEGRFVKAGGLEFYVANISGNTATLIDVARVSGNTVKFSRNKKVTYEITGKVNNTNGTVGAQKTYAIQERYKVLRSIFSPVSKKGYDVATKTYEQAGKLTGQLPKDKMNKGAYFIDYRGNTSYGGKDNPFKEFTGSGNKSYTFEDAKTIPVSAHVRIDVDLNYWSIQNDGTMKARRTSPYLQVGNVFYSGINQGIIDAIMANNIGTVSPSRVQDGSTVLIGDMEFVKQGNNYVSKPQTYLKPWRGVLKDATNLNLVKNTVFKQFTGMVVKVGTQAVPLAAFVRNPSLAEPPANVEVDSTLIGDATKANIATDSETGRSIKAYNKNNVPVIKSVVFKIQLDDNIRLRPIDTETQTYQLMLSTSSLSEGFMEEVPFFDESLGLTSEDDLYLTLTKSDFKPIQASDDIKQQFLKDYDAQFRSDLYRYTKEIICWVLIYLIAVSHICYAIVNKGVGLTTLELIRSPIRGSERNGVDVVKLISLGQYNLDTPLSLGRMVLGNILMFCLIYVVVFVI